MSNKSSSARGIVALAGRLIDLPGAEPRFPVTSIERVRRELESRITSRISGLVSSAACGADLLALDTADRVGVPYQVVLPFPPDVFRRASVVDRPGADWEGIFDNIIAKAARTERLWIDHLNPNSDASFRATNRRILQLALAWDGEGERPESELTSRVAVIVWEGQSRGPQDLTDHFRKSAQKEGFKIETVLTFTPGA